MVSQVADAVEKSSQRLSVGFVRAYETDAAVLWLWLSLSLALALAEGDSEPLEIRLAVNTSTVIG
jgi:hypothetical protein